MEKGSVIKHILIRILILIILMFASIFIGLATLNPHRRCGTGDALAFIPWFLGFYLLWSLGLFYEIFSLTKRKQKVKRNGNLIMIFSLPAIIILLWLYFEIKNINKKHEQIKTVRLYKIPKSYRNKKDVLVDSLFLNVPSEGSIVKKYKKNRSELFTINSISSMNKYNYEIYYKSDSIFILKKAENYDRPLNIVGAKLININREYALFVNDSLLQYVRNDTIKDSKKEKANELRNLLKILITK